MLETILIAIIIWFVLGFFGFFLANIATDDKTRIVNNVQKLVVAVLFSWLGGFWLLAYFVLLRRPQQEN